MRLGVPWGAKGIRAETRETAKEAARRAGVSLDDWMNSAILQQAVQGGVQPRDRSSDEIAGARPHGDDLSRQADQSAGRGAAAYAPPHLRAPAVTATPSMPPELERALAEIAARQRTLYGDAAAQPFANPAGPATHPGYAALEAQMRRITDQIETLRTPGVEQAIRALRAELSDIGRALNEALPRRELQAIENQIRNLSARIVKDRRAGADVGALAGIERGLAGIRDALHGLTPAENLVGYSDAIAGLAQKIDLIVADRDPVAMRQLENAVTALRGMVAHVASGDAVSRLAADLQRLADKVERISHAGSAGDALANIERRIDTLGRALAGRTESGTAAAQLEALVASLAEKIERIGHAGSSGDAFANIERRIDALGQALAGRTDHSDAILPRLETLVASLSDQVAALTDRLEAPDSRPVQLGAIERGLADVLLHIEDLRAALTPGAANDPAVDALRDDVARTHEAIAAMHDTLDLVAERIAGIEQSAHAGQPTAAHEPFDLTSPILAAPVPKVFDAPTLTPEWQSQSIEAPAAPAHPLLRPAPVTIEPASRPDEPLEPGSGAPAARNNPAARIAASEADLGGALPASPSPGHSSFIAAARRAAQAAAQQPDGRRGPAAPIPSNNRRSLRGKMMSSVKSLFIAASIVALVVGSVQIGGTMFGAGGLTRLATIASQHFAGKTKIASHGEAKVPQAKTEPPPLAPAPAKLAEKALQPAQDSSLGLTMPPALSADLINQPPATLPAANAAPAAPAPPQPREALNPPADVTGSIPAPKQPPAGVSLPEAIGGAYIRNAAIAGDAAAAYEIGMRYAEGRGVPANAEEAVRWFERAASKGLAPAQFRYASQLEKGVGVKKDLAAARRLYLAAATQGNAKAMHNLAVIYAEGGEGKPDYQAAAKWFLAAAKHGIADSQYNVGILYARGIGVPVNFADSYKWFALAAAAGDREAGKKRDDVATHLDAAALAAARRAAETFKAEPQPTSAVNVPPPQGGWDKAAAPAKAAPHTALNLGKW